LTRVSIRGKVGSRSYRSKIIAESKEKREIRVSWKAQCVCIHRAEQVVFTQTGGLLSLSLHIAFTSRRIRAGHS